MAIMNSHGKHWCSSTVMQTLHKHSERIHKVLFIDCWRLKRVDVAIHTCIPTTHCSLKKLVCGQTRISRCVQMIKLTSPALNLEALSSVIILLFCPLYVLRCTAINVEADSSWLLFWEKLLDCANGIGYIQWWLPIRKLWYSINRI